MVASASIHVSMPDGWQHLAHVHCLGKSFNDIHLDRHNTGNGNDNSSFDTCLLNAIHQQLDTGITHMNVADERWGESVLENGEEKRVPLGTGGINGNILNMLRNPTSFNITYLGNDSDGTTPVIAVDFAQQGSPFSAYRLYMGLHVARDGLFTSKDGVLDTTGGFLAVTEIGHNATDIDPGHGHIDFYQTKGNNWINRIPGPQDAATQKAWYDDHYPDLDYRYAVLNSPVNDYSDVDRLFD